MTGVHTIDDWDVIVVEQYGIYIRGDDDPWKIASHDELIDADTELGRLYRSYL